MTIHGHVENGKIVVDDPQPLPEGAIVRIEVVTAQSPNKNPAPRGRLRSIIGAIDDLPIDASENLDHYLYGHPKN